MLVNVLYTPEPAVSLPPIFEIGSYFNVCLVVIDVNALYVTAAMLEYLFVVSPT